VGEVWRWHELNQWQSVEANKVPDEALPTTSAKVSIVIDERIRIHAPIANHLETFTVREGFGSALEICEVDLLLPVNWNLKLLHLFVTNSGGLECFKSEPEDTQTIIDIHLGNAQWLSLANVADEISRSIENSLVEKWALNHSLVRLLNELVDEVVCLVDLG
jgi:hypothetical protein